MVWYWIVLISLHSLGTLFMWFVLIKIKFRKKGFAKNFIIAMLLMIVWELTWVWFEIVSYLRRRKEKQKEKAY